MADDSGLAVDALNGMPGVLSARWSGRHGDDAANLELVLGQLADVPDERRGAAFVCAAALVRARRARDRRARRVARAGSCGHRAAPAASATTRSSCRTARQRTSAELTPEEKDAASHRGRAMRALLPHLHALT